ncbi:hypothetical protein [Rhizobium sp. BR 314]|uniref:hypothetical protein n=1 Tax=Rhizobium sp. BR 314 TaxID=3040013 RepID=UPI0039BF1441
MLEAVATGTDFRFRLEFRFMNFIIQPNRYALSIAVIAAGFLLMETAPSFWPPIYQNARASPSWSCFSGLRLAIRRC